MDLPENYDKEEFERIKKAAEKIRSDSQVLIVIGIGGSYLGARAAVEFCKSQNYNLVCKDTPQIFFTGNSISSSALSDIVSLCENKDFSINVISNLVQLPSRPLHLEFSESCLRASTAKKRLQSEFM